MPTPEAKDDGESHGRDGRSAARGGRAARRYWQVVRLAIQSRISVTPAVSTTFDASGGI